MVAGAYLSTSTQMGDLQHPQTYSISTVPPATLPGATTELEMCPALPVFIEERSVFYNGGQYREGVFGA